MEEKKIMQEIKYKDKEVGSNYTENKSFKEKGMKINIMTKFFFLFLINVILF